jgi:hypothetical protein
MTGGSEGEMKNRELAVKAKAASRRLALADAALKNKALLAAARS